MTVVALHDPDALAQSRFLAIQSDLEPGTLPYARQVREGYARLCHADHPTRATDLACLDAMIAAHEATPGGYAPSAHDLTSLGISVVKFAPDPRFKRPRSSGPATRPEVLAPTGASLHR